MVIFLVSQGRLKDFRVSEDDGVYVRCYFPYPNGGEILVKYVLAWTRILRRELQKPCFFALIITLKADAKSSQTYSGRRIYQLHQD